jgi:hypothetical protein
MFKPHLGSRGTNGRTTRSRPPAPEQRSGNRVPYPDERSGVPAPRAAHGEPPAGAPAESADPLADLLADNPLADDPLAQGERTSRTAHPPLDVVLELTKGEGPIAPSARALGIALLAAMGLVLVGLLALVGWGISALF